jgi:hypothetical protein
MREVTPGRSVQLTEPFGDGFFEEQGVDPTMWWGARWNSLNHSEEIE